MRILVVGSTAKEHAIIWKLYQGEIVEEVFCAPGNFGTHQLAESVDIRPYEVNKLAEFAKENNITLTIATDKIALDSGIVNTFNKQNLNIFGPEKNAMRPIMQRSFAKKFFHKHKIPTAKFSVFDKEGQAIDYARESKFPILIKLNSATPEINTFYCETFKQAKNAIERAFANLNKRIIIEEYKEGKEISFPILTDGYNAVPMPTAVTYKTLLEGNGGSYTNGIGAYASADFSMKQEDFIAQNIVFPVLDGLNADNMSFSGILNFRLKLLNNGDIQLLELDSDFNGVEAQTILPIIDEDMAKVFYSTAIGALEDEYQSLKTTNEYCTSLMFYQAPYPGELTKGNVIEIEEEIDDDLLIFYNKVKQNKYFEKLVDGAFVLSLSTTGSSLSMASDKLYTAVDYINFEGKRFRKDVAQVNLIGV